MKTITLLSCCAAMACAAFAETKPAAAAETTDPESKAELEEAAPAIPWFWGFGNYGIYSGYQLYGNLLNSEPTLQGYFEGNMNLKFIDDVDLGYFGVGIWSNSDLTDKRRGSGYHYRSANYGNGQYGKAFNEWDFNIHWGKTFWFDDKQQYGLDYRCGFVWYYYPHRRHNDIGNGSTMTTMDFNHWFTLKTPYVDLFLTYVREYHENNANLWEFGLKHTFVGDYLPQNLSLTPSATFVVRSHRYNWCFPTAGWGETHNGGLATAKIGLDANYQLTDHIGIFAKVAYCSIIDNALRDAAEHGSCSDYSQYKDFAWGGMGLSFNF